MKDKIKLDKFIMFSNRLKECRCDKGISRRQLAAYLGVSTNAIASWENNKIVPTVKHFIALTNYFNVTADYLAGRQ